jgi:uncharacterized protein YdhG (YjbR/CyaY superfamily)
MQSKAKSVSAYLEAVPAARRACLVAMRAECLEILAGYEEGIEYGMPCYKRNGVAEVAFASQARYISLYILKTDVVKAHAAALAGLDVGKGCIRFPNPARIDFAVVRSLLAATARSSGHVC